MTEFLFTNTNMLKNSRSQFRTTLFAGSIYIPLPQCQHVLEGCVSQVTLPAIGLLSILDLEKLVI